MKPVAQSRPNVEQDRLVLALRGGKRLLAPLMPLNRLVHGRPQIGGRSAGEGVEGGGGHDHFSLYPARARDLPCVTLCPLWVTILCRPLLESNLPPHFRTYCHRRRAAVALRPRLVSPIFLATKSRPAGWRCSPERPCRMAWPQSVPRRTYEHSANASRHSGSRDRCRDRRLRLRHLPNLATSHQSTHLQPRNHAAIDEWRRPGALRTKLSELHLHRLQLLVQAHPRY